MGSSGRNGDDAKGADSDAQRPLERGPDGRYVIRSSSHPPTEQTGSVDVSGVHDRPDRPSPRERVVVDQPRERPRERRDATPTGRKSTPAERPRKRRALAAQVDLRARCDTPRALPGERPSQRPGHQVNAAAVRPGPVTPLALPPAVAEARPVVEEVTRRVRRPESNPALGRWSSSQRAIIAAIALVAFAALALSVFR